MSFPRRRESRKQYEHLLRLYHGKPKDGTLYIGVTSDLVKRVYEHKEGIAEGFTKKYDVKHLVHYEVTNDVESAIQRETQMKKWNRKWKLRLIEQHNPEWKDLYEEIVK